MLLVPTAVSSVDAAWFALASIVQNGVRRAHIDLGDEVVIVGVGILGQLACQYARLSGARSVIAIDPAPDRLATATRLAATAGLAMTVEEAAGAVDQITRGHMADVVIDVTGSAAVFQPALRLCRRLGRFVLLGSTGFPSRQCLTADVMSRGITITAAHDRHPPEQGNEYYFWSHTNMQRLFFDFLAQGRMQVAPLTSHLFPPEQAPKVYRDLLERRGDFLGVLFDWQCS